MLRRAVYVSMCVSVSLFARIYLDPHGRSLPIFVHVAYRRGSVLLQGVAQYQVEGVIFEVFFPIDNALYAPCSGMNFATKDRFGLNLLLYRKV